MKHFVIPAIAALALLGCKPNAHVEVQSATLPNPNIEVSNRINDKPVPMKPTLALKQTEQVRVVQPNGSILITHLTTRAQGTRAPIHIHPFGGQTCVIQGQMTLYMDGAEPAVKNAGECYWMPARQRMSGVNSGASDAIMYDTFLVPTEEDIWLIVEPDLNFTQKQLNAPYHKH